MIHYFLTITVMTMIMIALTFIPTPSILAFSPISRRRTTVIRCRSSTTMTTAENAEERQRRRRSSTSTAKDTTATATTKSPRRKSTASSSSSSSRVMDSSSSSSSSSSLLTSPPPLNEELLQQQKGRRSQQQQQQQQRRVVLEEDLDGVRSSSRRRRSNNDDGSFFPQHAMMQHDILTRDQEMELGRHVQTAQKLQAKMQEVAVQLQLQTFQQQQQQQNPSNKGISNNNRLRLNNDLDEMDLSFSSRPFTPTPKLQPQRHQGKKSTLIPWKKDEWLMQFNWTDHDVIHHLGLPGGRDELRRTLKDGAVARQTLITSNVRLVVSIAKQWLRRGGGNGGMSTQPSAGTTSSLYTFKNTNNNNNNPNYVDFAATNRPSLDEVVQEGILGLVKAVERYDPTFELRFGTYATHWITSTIRRCFQEHSTGCLKVPLHYHQIAQQYRSHVKQYYQLHMTPPTLEQVAQELHLSARRLSTILACTQPLVSLDAPRQVSFQSGGKAGSDIKGKSEIDGDILANALACSEPRPEEQVELSFLRQCLENAMSSELSPHERDVVRLRLGLDDGVSRTVRQVSLLLYGGDSMHMSEIRAAEQRALKKLRSPYALHTHKLLRYLDSVELINPLPTSL